MQAFVPGAADLLSQEEVALLCYAFDRGFPLYGSRYPDFDAARASSGVSLLICMSGDYPA